MSAYDDLLDSLDYITVRNLCENTGETATRPIRFDLTTEEITATGKMLAEKIRMLTMKEDALADLRKSYREHLERLVSERDGLMEMMLDPDTPSEQLTRIANELALAEQNIQSVKMEMQSSITDLKSECLVLAAENERLRNRITNGFEVRMQTCMWFADYNTTNKEYLLCHFAERIVETREIPASHLQVVADFGDEDVPEGVHETEE